MSTTARKIAFGAACCAFVVLGGCGGGGGGGSGPSAQLKPPSGSGAATPAPASVPAPAATQGNAFALVVPASANIQPAGQSAASGSTATVAPVTGGNTKSTSLTVSGGGIAPIQSGTLSCSGADCNEFGPNVRLYSREQTTLTNQTTATHESSGLLVSTLTGAAPLKSSYYGLYLSGNSEVEGLLENSTFIPTSPNASGANMVALHGGTETSSSQMASLKNSNVQATYSGAFAGTALQHGPNGTLASLVGNVGLNANFGTGSVSGNVYNVTNVDPNGVFDLPAGYGLRLDGKVSGSTYKGTTAFTTSASSPGAAAVGAARGDLLGGFYGANARETTGVTRIQGVAPGSTATTTVTGSFGATKR